MTAMNGQVVLVTGANSGLGKASAMGLAKRGATVVMACRNRERGESARREIVAESGNQAVGLLIADLSSQEAVRQLAQEFIAQYTRLDVLINNAGGIFMSRLLSAQGIEYSLAFNHLASFLLTTSLLDILKASAPARVVNVTTRLFANAAIHFEDMQFEKRRYSGFQAYTETKLANILFTYALARMLQGTGVTVNCVHPGIFKSHFGNQGMPGIMRIVSALSRPFMASAESAAERVLYVATAPELREVSGKYFGNKRELSSPKQSYDVAAQKQLWQISEALTGRLQS